MMNANIEALSEDEIVTKLKSGELDSEGAYATLVTKLYPFLHRAARHYARDLDLAEDVVVDTLARLPRVLDSYKGKGSLRAYLLLVLRNSIFDHYRHEARGEMMQNDLTQAGDPQDNIESLHLLREVLNNLTEEERLIVTAYAIEGASLREIAGMLNISLATAQRRLSGAMKKMRGLVTEQRTA